MPECDQRAKSRGWCNVHYQRWFRCGDPEGCQKPSDEERFFARVTESPSGCWLWDKPNAGTGYGHFHAGGRRRMAHRWAYEFLITDIPEELQLDHLCRNRACVNPWHLDPVTPGVNIRRGVMAPWCRDKTHCKRGHPFDEANTMIDSKGGRVCRTCNRERLRLRRSLTRSDAA